jgi:hypothetical protein
MLSTPAFCLVPGTVALYEAFKKGRSGFIFEKARIPLLLSSLLLLSLAILWGYGHYRGVLATAAHYSYDWHYGAHVEDVFHLKLAKWADFLREGFFVFPALVLAVVVGSWALWSHTMARHGRRKNEAKMACLALIQVMVTLIIFASARQQNFRYILPFAPFLTVLVVWSVFQVNRAWMSGAVAAALVLQLALVQAHDYGVLDLGRRYGENTPLQTGPDSRFELIEVILGVISDGPVAPVILEMRAFSLDGAQVTYEAFKKAEYSPIMENILTRRIPPVHSADNILLRFEHGLSEAGENDVVRSQTIVDAMWKNLIELEPGYFVMPSEERRRAHFEYVRDAVVGGLVAERLSLELAERVAKSALFQRVDTPGQLELEIYRYGSGEDQRKIPTNGALSEISRRGWGLTPVGELTYADTSPWRAAASFPPSRWARRRSYISPRDDARSQRTHRLQQRPGGEEQTDFLPRGLHQP